jgi:hypothetical protein
MVIFGFGDLRDLIDKGDRFHEVFEDKIFLDFFASDDESPAFDVSKPHVGIGGIKRGNSAFAGDAVFLCKVHKVNYTG